ncbi:sulfurtransferase [Acidisphaera sp. L21]|uniref:sulfurtransferase n=1 Tax=Acidisphaera sp. L21 TaxID=1641851 RepID=UPI00131E90BA|nr:sulfurtransferase [Acidisphaera sp. L21]
MDDLVSVDWLAANLGAPDLVVLESTKYLPNEKKDGKAAFLAAHIPGARYFDLDLIADTDSALPHMVPAAGRFSKLVGALGVADTSRVVFYDQNATMWATRGWWMMGLFGHDSVTVLDGGLAAWTKAGRAIEMGEPAAASAVPFTARLRAERLRGLTDMLETEALIVDARAAARYAGTAPEPRPGLVAGHIPGSINIPFTTMLDVDGRFLPQEQLREALAKAGVDGSRPVVTTCGSGVSATMVTMAMKRAGLSQGAVYDGSWTEWGLDPTTPKATGA